MTELTVTELITAALAATDSDGRWNCVVQLHRRDHQETFDAARELCRSADTRRRILGVDVIAQLGARVGIPVEQRQYRAAGVQLLLDLIEHERDPEVLAAIGVAFGHLSDIRCIEPLSRLRDHPDPEVRYGVTFGLNGFDEDSALDVLVELSADPDKDVRDWATFGLGSQTKRDFPRLREALLARLDDSDEETREEALCGLARRGDDRAITPLLDSLGATQSGVEYPLLEEALLALAAKTGDERLYDLISKRRANWRVLHPEEPMPAELQAAVDRYARRDVDG
jgi:HEAT repeat protein